ncbi:MAG: LL-diaminopimelate aminotransferase [Planctomycetota bacterium]|jgi:LL-diaminopimelate aminotransferase
MADPYFQKLFADRIGGVNYGKDDAIYKFEKIKRAKRKALADNPGVELLDFGIGENDMPADEKVAATMATECGKRENSGYADNGVDAFKEAVGAFMKTTFGVELDPSKEIIHGIGSKPALAILPKCFINPGDVTLMTVPGYPVAGTHTSYCGGEVHKLPLLPENDFFPDLDTIPADVLTRAKLLVINYPNSPTGKVATLDFYKKVVDFAKANELVVVQDAAHSLLVNEGEPLSFLSVPGAMDVGVEVHSLSKGFNMIGWRLGWVCGNELLVQAYGDVKDNSDSGQFIATQLAGKTALETPSIWQDNRVKYRRRCTKLAEALQSVGFDAQVPGGTYFMYMKAPTGIEGGPSFANGEEASQWLITEKSIVTVPWDDAGPHLRFSTTYFVEDEAGEDALMAELLRRLDGVKFTF